MTKSTLFSASWVCSSGWSPIDAEEDTWASMCAIAFLYGSASSARSSAVRIFAVETISIVRVICIVALTDCMRLNMSRWLAIR